MVVAQAYERHEQERGAPGKAPLRGTQSFVAVMSQVLRRPALPAIELLWRWGVAVPLLWLAWRAGFQALQGVFFDTAALQNMTVFKPVAAAAVLTTQLRVLVLPLLPIARWWVPLALVLWAAAGGLGRTVILRRLDPTLRNRFGQMAVVSLIRSLGLLAVLAVWCWGVVRAGHFAVTGPAQAGAEPNVVLYAALAVALTLALFMLWSLMSWPLDAAPLFAMAEDLSLGASLRAAVQAGGLRSKLIETNLVMGIVRVALLVLAMVFSASPLPFTTVATQGYLNLWWEVVAVVYLIGSDLFHVVRRATYLALFRALVPAPVHATNFREPAS